MASRNSVTKLVLSGKHALVKSSLSERVMHFRIAKRASDVMTQTRLRQTNRNAADFLKTFLKRKLRLGLNC